MISTNEKGFFKMKKRVSGNSAKKRFRRFFTGIILMMVICISFGAFLVSAHEKTSADDTVYKYYKSIEIQSGDTLWAIAEDTMTDEYNSVAEYVQVLKDMNNLDSDNIQAGQNLIIAYNDSVLY